VITVDYHVHTEFSDGADAIDAVAAQAYASGMTAIGFSEHVYAPYDTDVCMREGTAPAYKEPAAGCANSTRAG
jgi:Histidinol phosphatase and related hydrolases of the PHP family